jgi:uncharacterized HhH-GPD family protein
MTATATTPPDLRLHYTGDADADRLIATDPFALLVGFALDQQVTVQKAFSGPMDLRRRLGHLDPGRIAATDLSQLERAFRDRPAIHRFPGAMARRVHDLATAVAERYGGDAAAVWGTASDGADLERRLLELPSIGPMKAASIMAVLAKRLGVRVPGLERRLPKHQTLGDVDSPEALARYQEAKRAHKAALRAEAARR